MSYILERVREEELKFFISAWEGAFNRKLDGSIYEWIFSSENIKFVLKYNNKIAAGYCLYPVECYLNKRKTTGLLCNNVFVLPEFQGKHLFVKIGKAALLEASNKKLGEIAFGIPNRLALPGHKRVGWGLQKPIVFLEKSVSPVDRKNNNIWTYGDITESQRENIAACSRRSSENRFFSIVKTESFIKWRYESKPLVKYWYGMYEEEGVLTAYCVCKFYEEKNIIHIIDIDGFSEEGVKSLVDDIETLPESFNKINIWSSTAHKKTLLDIGFEATEEFSNLIFMDLNNLEPFYLNGNINLCLGDNDVY